MTDSDFWIRMFNFSMFRAGIKGWPKKIDFAGIRIGVGIRLWGCPGIIVGIRDFLESSITDLNKSTIGIFTGKSFLATLVFGWRGLILCSACLCVHCNPLLSFHFLWEWLQQTIENRRPFPTVLIICVFNFLLGDQLVAWWKKKFWKLVFLTKIHYSINENSFRLYSAALWTRNLLIDSVILIESAILDLDTLSYLVCC